MICIDEIKFYGQWDRNNSCEFEFWWWYSLYDERVYSVEDLLKTFSFENYDVIKNSYAYIPLWKTDERQLIRDFILNELKDKKFERFLNDPHESFYYYITSNDNYITRWWEEYLDLKLVDDAINWCRENNIPFKK